MLSMATYVAKGFPSELIFGFSSIGINSFSLNGLELTFIYRSTTREEGVTFAFCSNLCSSNGFNFDTLPCYLACCLGCQPFAFSSHCLCVDSNNTSNVSLLAHNMEGTRPGVKLSHRSAIIGKVRLFAGSVWPG